MKNILLKLVIVISTVYILLCTGLYFFQEKLIFHPQKLNKSYEFNFNQDFEEMYIKTSDGIYLNAILFKAENSKSLIFHLHGNAGTIKEWGKIANIYTDLGYDFFILDYRGFGKSEDKISNQKDLFDDAQVAYNEIKKYYNESDIIVSGYSIGTGIASWLASKNNPKLLILQAPYYNLTDVMKHHLPFIPTFILKYRLETNKYIKDCNMPVVIFHGTKDKTIPYSSSLKLKEENNDKVSLISLKGESHTSITKSENYKNELKIFLNAIATKE